MVVFKSVFLLDVFFLPCLPFQKKVEKEEQMTDGTKKDGRTVNFNLTISTITLNTNGLNLYNSLSIVFFFLCLMHLEALLLQKKTCNCYDFLMNSLLLL